MLGSINSVGSMNNVSFQGLPRHLWNTNLTNTDVKGVTEIIRDAGIDADVVIKTYPKKVLEENPGLFDEYNRVSPAGAQKIKGKYNAETCRELRDALALKYKAGAGKKINFEKIV